MQFGINGGSAMSMRGICKRKRAYNRKEHHSYKLREAKCERLAQLVDPVCTLQLSDICHNHLHIALRETIDLRHVTKLPVM